MAAARIAILFAVCAGLGACGRNLTLESRQDLSPDDLSQSYQLVVYIASDGTSRYTASVAFAPVGGVSTALTELPAGDALTVNGVAMTHTSGAFSYSASATGNPGTYAFVWTHGAKTYNNTLTADLYRPVSEPTFVSKGAGVFVQVPGVPAGTQLSGNVASGVPATGPTVAIPVSTIGGGSSPQFAPNLRGLHAGPGILTLVESRSSALQAATAGGGRAVVTVQFGYAVTIGE